MPDLSHVAAVLVAEGRGILAADESIGTMSARLTAEGIEASETTRRDYRELLLTAPGLAKSVSGIILCDETFRQSTSSGEPFPKACLERGILPGIKVDTGTSQLPKGGGATITEGLDGLAGRLAEYAAQGAAFAKWRAVIDIATTSDFALAANAHSLGRYAALCQQHGIVPVVEPEVLCSGSHDLAACVEVTERTLAAVFDQLVLNKVDLSAMILKPNMITPGLNGPQASPAEVAEATVGLLGSFVPPSVPGIAFLSGGHSTQAACDYLSAINNRTGSAPWALSYSFGRALVSDALRTWKGIEDQRDAAQRVLIDNCRRASDATRRPVSAG
jgi:fructose-bisphosphate aldolase, class I